MIGLAFALDHEAAGILPLLKGAESFRVGELPCHVGTLEGKKTVVAILGMGAETAGRRAAILAEHFALDFLVLAGYAGALVPELRRNAVVVASNYLSLGAAPRAERIGARSANLHSAAAVAGTPEARKALADRGFEIVDMETAAVAAVAQARMITFLPLRVISDEAGDVLPTAALDASFDAVKQKPRILGLLAHLAAHPGDIAPFFRFMGHLGPARERLTEAVLKAAAL